MAQELVKLRLTSNLTEERSEIIDKEFDGFQKLFGNFLAAESQVISGSIKKRINCGLGDYCGAAVEEQQ